MLYLSCFIFNHNIMFFYHKFWICYFVMFLYTIFRCRQRHPQPSNFRLPTTYCDHWKTEHYRGSDGFWWGIFWLRDLNRLASVNHWQYTTVPHQCERFTWTRAWRLLYFDCWYHFNKRPCRVYSVTQYELILQEGSCLLCLKILQ